MRTRWSANFRRRDQLFPFKQNSAIVAPCESLRIKRILTIQKFMEPTGKAMSFPIAISCDPRILARQRRRSGINVKGRSSNQTALHAIGAPLCLGSMRASVQTSQFRPWAHEGDRRRHAQAHRFTRLRLTTGALRKRWRGPISGTRRTLRRVATLLSS
jgi:hypothetical protein